MPMCAFVNSPFNSIRFCLNTRCYPFGIISPDSFHREMVLTSNNSISSETYFLGAQDSSSVVGHCMLCIQSPAPQIPKLTKNLASRHGCFSTQQAGPVLELTSRVFPFPALTASVSWKSFSFFFSFFSLLWERDRVWSLLFYLGWKQRFLNSIFLLKHCFPVLFLIDEIICIYRVQCDTWIHAYTLWNG